MKKLILLGLATMITFSASAQIEMYKEKQQVQVKEKSWQEKKKEYLDTLQQNTTYPLLSLYRSNRKYLIGDTLYSVRDSLYRRPIFVLTSTNDSIRFSQLPIGEYFQVVDMIVCKEEKDSLFNSFNNKVFVKGKKIRKKVEVRGTKIPIWEVLYRNIYPIYVLKKNDTIYYVNDCYTETHEREVCLTFSLLGGLASYTEAFVFADISDFVSVKSYNMLKSMYVGKEFVSIETRYISNKKGLIRQVEESSIWTIEKLLLKGTDFYAECASNDDQKEGGIIEIRTPNIGDKHFSFGSPRPESDILCVLSVGEQEFILKSEADVLIAKFKYEEEQKALAEKKRQTQHKNDIIKKYGEKYGSLILQGKICVGMTQEMCIEAKGTPCKKNKSSDKYGTIEVWTYNCLGVEWAWKSGLSANYTFVTFKNGKITDITE